MRFALLTVFSALFVAIPGMASEVLWDFAIAEHGVPNDISAGTTMGVPLEVVNQGNAPWRGEDGVAISYHWLDANLRVVVWDGARTPLTGVVESGDRVRLEATLLAPEKPGRYLLQWDVVQEHVRWFSEESRSAPRSISVTVRADHAMTVIEAQSIWCLAPASEVVREVKVRNDGTITWRDDGAFALSYHWFDLAGEPVVWDGLRSSFAVPVAPGETAIVKARVRAPDRSGMYQLRWDVVHEGVTWFSEQDQTPEPHAAVWVRTGLAITPAVWSVATVGLAVFVLAVPRRRTRGTTAELVTFADIVWLAGVLLVVQRTVLAEGGQTLTVTGHLLSITGVAAALLVLLAVPARMRPWLAWSVGTIVVLGLFADLVYQRFFGDILSVAAVVSARQIGHVGASVWSVTVVRDLWLVALLLVGLVLAMAARRRDSRVGARWRRLLGGALLVVLVSGTIAGAWYLRSGVGVMGQVFRNVYLARDVGVINFHAYDVAHHLMRGFVKREISENEFDQVVRWFQKRAPSRAGGGPWFGAALGSDLLMIQVESLQRFVLGFEINGQPVTPFLNRLAEKAIVFTNITDQTAQGRSSDSELATQVSLLPPSRGAAAFLYPNNDFTGLAEVLAGHGYQTLSAVPFDGAFWNRQLTHPAFGFAQNLFAEDFSAGEEIGWGLTDRDFFGQMVPRLAGLEQPFCAWLLTLSLHHPFSGFPAKHKRLDLEEWEGTPFGNFMHTMHFFDRALEDLFAGLATSGLSERMTVVLWGDHDAGLDWQPVLASALGRRHDDVGWYLSQQVPLLIHVPGQEELRGERTIAGGHQDVAPTILSLLGVDPSEHAFMGRNLLGDPGDVPVVGEYQCWQSNQYLFLQRGSSLDVGECYDVETLQRVDVGTCASGYVDASRQVEIASLVLEHDLQRRIHERLVDSVEIRKQ